MSFVCVFKIGNCFAHGMIRLRDATIILETGKFEANIYGKIFKGFSIRSGECASS